MKGISKFIAKVWLALGNVLYLAEKKDFCWTHSSYKKKENFENWCQLILTSKSDLDFMIDLKQKLILANNCSVVNIRIFIVSFNMLKFIKVEYVLINSFDLLTNIMVN
jgi:hypothetical protein